MIQGFPEPSDRTARCLRGRSRKRPQDLLRKLQQSVVPQHKRRNLENIFENIFVLRCLALKCIQRIGQRNRYIRPERLQSLDGVVNVNIVLGYERSEEHTSELQSLR